ncbi:MAG: Redoxin [Pyrinomonadaceae bacterium]|jgi:thioredoxin-related protein|nr:Redoxin [Pyrinomonadaceae bacterium]
MPLTDVNWGENGTTLLMVLQKGCRYCEGSAAFYRKLYDQRGQRPLPRILAVMPGDKSESLSYLSEHGVAVDDVVSKNLSEVKVSATPTLLLIDRSGRIADVWVGKLKEADERRVIQRIFDLQ